MKRKHYLLGMILSALCIAPSLTSCSQDDELTGAAAYGNDPNAVIVNATIGSPLTETTGAKATRVDTEGDGNEWTYEDQIYVENTSAKAITGKKSATYKYSYDSNDKLVWTLQGTDYMVWADGENTFTAYYPYGATDADGNAVQASYSSFTLLGDQRNDNIQKADWMIATDTLSKPEDKTLNLTFEHQLARVTINLTKGAQYENSTYNIQYSHAYVPTTDVDSRISYQDSYKEDGLHYVIAYKVSGQTVFHALLPRGKYAAGQKLFNVENWINAGKGEYEELYVLVPTSGKVNELLCTTGLESGKAYTFNVTVGKDVMTITSVSVEDWTTGTLTNGTGTAEEAPAEYVSVTGNTIQINTAGALSADSITKALNGGTVLTLTGKMNVSDFSTLRTATASTLTKLDLSKVSMVDANGNAITELPSQDNYIGALEEMTSLTEVTLPTTCTSLGRYAFCKCYALTTINGLDQITTVGAQAFIDCTSLTRLYLPNATSIEYVAFDNTGLTEIELSGATKLGRELFLYNVNLTSIVFTASSFTEVDGNIFAYFNNTDNCTLTLNESQKDNVTNGIWTPVSGTNISITAFKEVKCGTETVWTKN